MEPVHRVHNEIGTLGAGIARFARLGFRLDGVLYGMDDACRLHTLDTATGSATLLGTVTGASCSSGDLAFGIDDTLYISAGFSDSVLYVVDTGTLVATEIHDVSTEQEIAGLVIEADGDLFSTRTEFLRFSAGTYTESTMGSFPVGVRLSDAASTPVTRAISGTVFEDVNYGGGLGRDRTIAAADAPSFTVGRGGVSVELYNAAGNHVTSVSPQSTDGAGAYSFSRVGPGTYTVRVVNSSVTSSRPGSDGSELGVQTYRADGISESAGDGTKKVGGEFPSREDAAANSGAQTLASLQGTDLDADGVPEWTEVDPKPWTGWRRS